MPCPSCYVLNSPFIPIHSPHPHPVPITLLSCVPLLLSLFLYSLLGTNLFFCLSCHLQFLCTFLHHSCLFFFYIFLPPLAPTCFCILLAPSIPLYSLSFYSSFCLYLSLPIFLFSFLPPHFPGLHHIFILWISLMRLFPMH